MNIGTPRHCSGLLRRIGIAGLLFFLVKGLLWLVAPFFVLWLV